MTLKNRWANYCFTILVKDRKLPLWLSCCMKICLFYMQNLPGYESSCPVSLCGPDRNDQRRRSPFIHRVISDNRFLCWEQSAVTAPAAFLLIFIRLQLQLVSCHYMCWSRTRGALWHLGAETLFKNFGCLRGPEMFPPGHSFAGLFSEVSGGKPEIMTCDLRGRWWRLWDALWRKMSWLNTPVYSADCQNTESANGGKAGEKDEGRKSWDVDGGQKCKYSRKTEPNSQARMGRRWEDQKMKEKVATIQLTLLGTRLWLNLARPLWSWDMAKIAAIWAMKM